MLSISMTSWQSILGKVLLSISGVIKSCCIKSGLRIICALDSPVTHLLLHEKNESIF